MTLKIEAYKIIKKKILNCEYPPNSFLTEEKLKEEIKMSRTPIRDALGRLEQENLVKIHPKKGFRIAGISKDEIEKIYELRLLMEPYTLKKFGPAIEAKVYREFEEFYLKQHDTSPQEKIFIKDDKFHQLFIDASKNKYLIRFYNSLYYQLSRIRVLSGHNKIKRLHESKKEHLEILCLCLRKNWAQAAKVLRNHLKHSKKSAFSINYDEI
jgi:DNA-binding GntR family transcriptional regulator